MNKKIIATTLCLSLAGSAMLAQESRTLPFLELNPDVRTAGMGDVPVMETSGMYIYSQPTSLLKSRQNLYGSYTFGMYPKGDIGSQFFHAASVGYRFQNNGVMGGFRYFQGAPVTRTDDSGNPHKTIHPYDWSIDLAYAYAFNSQWSFFIKGTLLQSYISKTAYTASGSFGFAYRNGVKLCGRTAHLLVSASLNDFGGKLQYGNKGKQYNIPTSVKAGAALEMPFNAHHQVNVALGARYFMLPSSASAFTGGVGAEYQLYKIASLRAGYHWGDHNNYVTIGAGCKIKFAEINVAYNIAKDKDFNLLRLGLNIGF